MKLSYAPRGGGLVCRDAAAGAAMVAEQLAGLEWSAGFCLLLALVLAWRVPCVAALIAAVAAGLLWGLVAADRALSQRVPPCADVAFQQLGVEVASRPERSVPAAARPVHHLPTAPRWQNVARFEAIVVASSSGACPVAVGSRLRLNWYDAPALAEGQRWQITARVRPPWSYQNPGGFDYERWLFSRGINGTGYVREGQLLRQAPRARRALEEWLKSRAPRHAGLILALVTGDRSGISSQQWELFRATGTVHLVVVSGLHVGLVCALGYGLAFALLRLSTLGRVWRPQPLAALAALALAAKFVVGAGAGVPALRAWLMSAGFLCMLTSGWRCSGSFVLLLSLVIVLLIQPLAVHQPGAYLSFGAVAALLGVLGLRGKAGWLAMLAQTQVVLFLVLTPVLAVQQGQVPGWGVLVNLLAVPLLACLLAPLLLVAWLFEAAPELASLVLLVAERCLDLKLELVALAATQETLRAGSLDSLELLATLASALLLLTTADWRWRLGLLLAWAVWVAPSADAVPPGEFRVSALDVGQGSSLVVATRRHKLLFDTGPAFPGGFDLGNAAVVPFLAATGYGDLDALVLSHPDSDHTGGAASVLEQIGSRRVYSSFALPAGLAARARSTRFCRAGVSWLWDGVTFTFLHPDGAAQRSSNDTSCVLRVQAASQALLISGDISGRIERRLLRRYGGRLRASVVTAPHHGSASSSSAPFVAATRPRVVIVSAARRSRYGHPHDDVVRRYRAVGARVEVTGVSGTLIWESWQPGEMVRRRDTSPYWINRVPEPLARARPAD